MPGAIRSRSRERERIVAKVEQLVRQLADLLDAGVITQKEDVNVAIHAFANHSTTTLKEIFQKSIPLSGRKRPVALKMRPSANISRL